MKLINLFLVLGLLFSAACSNNKKKGADGEKIEGAEDGEYVEYILNDEEGDDAALGDGDGGDDEEYVLDDEEGDELLADDDEGDEYEDDEEGDELASSSAPEISGDEATYRVKSGETYMMIAFKLYGDYRLWRKLSDLNGSSRTSAGQIIKYNKPAKKFSWNPDGLPYLIQGGDTLGTIASDKYGTSSKWRSIYNNNKPLIRDPNLIFAGFTLYYVSDEDRNLASE